MSLLVGLHPLTKLAFCLAILLLTFGLPWLWAPVGLFLAILLPLSWTAGVGRSFLAATLRYLLPLTFSVAVVQGLFYPGGRTPLGEMGPLIVWQEGVAFAFTVATRLLAAIGAILLFAMTTEPSDLVAALRSRGLPPTLGYIVLSALSLLPRMQVRVRTIWDAQRARGLEVEGGVLTRSRAVVPMLGPLITGTVEEAVQRAMALEARAFSARGPKTIYREIAYQRWEAPLSLLVLLATVLAVVAARLGA
ncbi:MAG: energy-coupling factor transporter transmembrane protein EcfT [Chloroflexi bacterium]|nr:energy-coupling factor transporter transmembrane protein EcfT [Chloroflexota bacterium]